MLAGVADALAAKIEENAKISNLTTANVKSILHVSVLFLSYSGFEKIVNQLS